LADNQHQYKVARWLLGNSLTDSIIAEGGKISVKRSFKLKWRLWKRGKEFDPNPTRMKRFLRAYQKHVSAVTCPLALISQVQLSGGSLLSQLLDGHPELHVHPHELQIGYPNRYFWPQIDLKKTPGQWFETLFEDMAVHHSRQGFNKMETHQDTAPFIFLPSLQMDIFINYLGSLKKIAIRDVFNAYMTSYFGAWVNNQNVIGEKKFVTGFAPGLANVAANMESYFEIYPEGRLISVIRDPKNWYRIAKGGNLDQSGDIRQVIGEWNESAEAMLRNKERFGEQICIVRFEDLTGRTETLMRCVSKFLDIRFEDILLAPTFNKMPLKSIKVCKPEDHQEMSKAVSRNKDLAQEELKIIDEITGAVYEKVVERAATIS
jgi:hypothetical protein